jgi:hypothetical protein
LPGENLLKLLSGSATELLAKQKSKIEGRYLPGFAEPLSN